MPSTCAEIDDRVEDCLSRPIEGDWSSLWLETTYVKVREVGRTVSVAVTIIVGVNSDGWRRVCCMRMGTFQAEAYWLDLLRSLTLRGLRGVTVAISEAHDGLNAAVIELLRAAW